MFLLSKLGVLKYFRSTDFRSNDRVPFESDLVFISKTFDSHHLAHSIRLSRAKWPKLKFNLLEMYKS